MYCPERGHLSTLLHVNLFGTYRHMSVLLQERGHLTLSSQAP